MSSVETGARDRIRGYFALRLAGFDARGDYFRLSLLTAGSVAAAVLLVHAFAPAGLTRSELLIHVSTLTASFILGLAVTGLLILGRLRAADRQPAVGHLWLVSAAGFAVGILISGAAETAGIFSQVAAKAAGLHGPGSMLPRLLPVWAVLTAFIVRARVMRTYEQRFDALQDNPRRQPSGSADQQIEIRSGTEIHVFRLADIVRIRAEENYCRFELAGEDQPAAILVRCTFKSVLELLPDSRFIQVHRSHAVNRSYVKRVVRRGRHFKILLSEQLGTVAISRRRLSEVLDQLQSPAGDD